MNFMYVVGDRSREVSIVFGTDFIDRSVARTRQGPPILVLIPRPRGRSLIDDRSRGSGITRMPVCRDENVGRRSFSSLLSFSLALYLARTSTYTSRLC